MTAIDTDVQEVQKMFNVNIFGPMRMVRHFHPLLIKAQGTIVNIGSVGGIVPYMYGCELDPPDHHSCALMCAVDVFTLACYKEQIDGGCVASYNATKAALAHWGNTLRVEMAPLG